MPVLKALKAFPYGVAPNRVMLKAGDLFNCDEKHVALVVGSHLATLPEVVIAKPVLAYQTRHMEAARTVPELRAEVEARGKKLPKGYVPKAELQRMIAEG